MPESRETILHIANRRDIKFAIKIPVTADAQFLLFFSPLAFLPLGYNLENSNIQI